MAKTGSVQDLISATEEMRRRLLGRDQERWVTEKSPDCIRWAHTKGFIIQDPLIITTRAGEVIWDLLRADPSVAEVEVKIRNTEPGFEHEREGTAFRFQDGSWIISPYWDGCEWLSADASGKRGDGWEVEPLR